MGVFFLYDKNLSVKDLKVILIFVLKVSFLLEPKEKLRSHYSFASNLY
jgi:hypothetical protein